MIASLTNNASLQQEGKKYGEAFKNTFMFYDKTVVFGNIPIDRDLLLLRNVNMLRRIKNGFTIKNTITNRETQYSGLPGLKITEEDIKKYEEIRRSDAILKRYLDSSYGLFSSRPLPFSFLEMSYYLYNTNGFVGRIASSGPAIDEIALIFFFISIYGYTLVGILLAIASARMIVDALTAGFNVSSAGAAQLCLKNMKLQYERIKLKGYGKGHMYNRLKLINDPKTSKIYNKILVNSMEQDEFLKKFQDRNICSNHPRSFGVVGTATFYPFISTKKTVSEECAKNLKTFSDEKYNKLKKSIFNTEAIAKSQELEKSSIDTINLVGSASSIIGRRNGLGVNANFANYYVRRLRGANKNYYKGKEYYKGSANVLKRSPYMALYYPQILVSAIGNGGAALSDSDFGTFYLGGLDFDNKGIIQFSVNLADFIESPVPFLQAYVFHAGLMSGTVVSRSVDKRYLLEKRSSFFPSLKTKLFGLGLASPAERRRTC